MTMSRNGRPIGRPSKFKPEMAERARTMATAGAVDWEIAVALGISLTSLYTWKAQHPDFDKALQRGKDVADDVVEAALFRRATGYSHDAVKILQNAGEAVVVPYVEHVAPDTNAAKFWLLNRRPTKWRDRQEVEHSGSLTLGDLVEAARKLPVSS